MPSKRSDDERLGMFRAITRRLAPIPRVSCPAARTRRAGRERKGMSMVPLD